MESITVYPKNKKQKSLLKSLLEEMKIRFEVEKEEETLIYNREFVEQIRKSEKQKSVRIPTDKLWESL